MKKVLFATASIMCLGAILGLGGIPEKARPVSASIAQPNVDYANVPIYFIPNKGQVHPDALYYAATPAFTLWVTGSSLVFDQVRESGGARGESRAGRSVSRLIFLDSNPNPKVSAAESSACRVNYFRGQDQSGWITDIPTSQAVVYKNLYDRVDLKIYGRGKQIEYDWLVRPGGKVSSIGFRYENIKASRVGENGNLEVETEFGKLIHTKPCCYQPIGRNKVEVAARLLEREDRSFGFEISSYDANYPLVIDPVVLVYSTYLGGSSADAGNGIAVDSAGAVYVTGFSASSDYPTVTPFQKSLKSGSDVVVTKINPKGDALVYSTFIGGSAEDWANDIAVDKSGNAYVVGATDSSNFPVQKPFQSKRKGTRDVFVAKLNAKGDALVFSTYLGGTSWEEGYAIAVDSKNSAYVTGNGVSSDFPLKNPYQKYGIGQAQGQVAFVTKFHPDGNKLIYSTYLGGSNGSMGRGICVDGQGAAYVTGDTSSRDFPVKNAVQATCLGWDAFITKFNPQGNDLEFSTYYGGSGRDIARGIAVAANGTVYMTGHTESSDFPTTKPYQSQFGGVQDAFVSKLNSKGSAILFSTYLGGSTFDYGCNVALDKDGNCYVVGRTYSSDFPIKQALQKTLKGAYAAFISKLSSSGKTLLYSTYLGGSIENQGNDIAVGADRSAYVTGQTYSLDFPLKNPIQSQKKGGLEGFVAKIK